MQKAPQKDQEPQENRISPTNSKKQRDKMPQAPQRRSTRLTPRAPHPSDRARASVRKGHSLIHGQGAFASRRIAAGTRVASMQHAAQTRDGASPGYPHDSVIHLASLGGIMVRDLGWTSPHHKPTWYVINHSAAGANVAARATRGTSGGAGASVPSGGQLSLDWVAIRDIERGEEILWRYQTGRTLTF